VAGPLDPFDDHTGIYGTARTPGGASIRFQRPKYVTRPPSFDEHKQAVFESISSIVSGQDLQPFNTQAILNDMRAMSSTPEVAYVLSNPKIIGEWQDAIWGNFLGVMGKNLPEQGINAGRPITNPEDNKHVARVIKKHDSKFSAEERKAIISIFSAVPTANELLHHQGFTPSSKGGVVGDLINGFKVVFGGHAGTVRPLLQDPREQMASLMHLYLRDKPVDTVQERAEFFTWLSGRAGDYISDMSRTQEGFGRIGAIVETPFAAASEFANDWIQMAANPEGFATRQHLSIGQNAAFGLGYNPGDSSWDSISGTFDGIVNLVADPINLVAGVGQGIKNASKIPRIASSKSNYLMKAANPFGGGKYLELPAFDRGLISRLTYAAFSKDADAITKTQRSLKTWDWMANTASESAIINRFKGLAGHPRIVALIAKATDPKDVQQIVKMGLEGVDPLSEDAPLFVQRVMAEADAATTEYITARQAFLDEGGGLGGLHQGIDVIEDGDTYVMARKVMPNEVDTATVQDPNAIRKGTRAAEAIKDAPIVEYIDTPAGRIAIRKQGDLVGAYTEDGRPVGGFIGREKTIGVSEEFQSNGIGTALLRVSGADPEDMVEAGVTMSGARLLGLGEESSVFTRVPLDGDGAEKFVISQLGTGGGVRRLNMDDPKEIAKFVKWAQTNGDEDALLLAARFELGEPGRRGLMNTSPHRQAMLRKYADAQDVDFLQFGDEIVASSRGRRYMVKGVDDTNAPAARMAEVNPSPIKRLTDAQVENLLMTQDTDSYLWVIHDLPQMSAAKFMRESMKSVTGKMPKSWAQGFRRAGNALTATVPENIKLTSTREGSGQLRNWLKMLGGSDELANRHVDAFRRGNPGNRKEIVMNALRDVGEEIENPMLANGLIEFGEKQGHYTYMFDRAGREIGLGADGSITPSTLSHFSEYFAMPDPKLMRQAIRRFKQAGRIPKRTVRGFGKVDGDNTKTRRAQIARGIRRKLESQGVDLADFTNEDIMKMAYSDVLGGQYGRASGAGAVNKAFNMAAKPLVMFHGLFTIAQLAGRPIAWASRVLIEESFRAALMGMPSLWKNPNQYVGAVADARAIRKMPEMLRAQGEATQAIVDNIFKVDPEPIAALEKAIPGIAYDLGRANIDLADAGRIRAYVSHRVGMALKGGDPKTLAQIGSRTNITRRTLLRERKLRNTMERMDEIGLMESFKWDIDGEAIANRSFYQTFIKEAEASTLPLEYSLESMTSRGLKTYGRGYGRQVYQMQQDAIVGTFGFHRAMARAIGTTTEYDEVKLVQSAAWQRIRHAVERRAQADGLTFADDLELAKFHLEEQVDVIMDTIFRPLAGDTDDYVRVLSEMKGGGRATIRVGGEEITLNASRSNYEGFVSEMEKVVTAGYHAQVEYPVKVAAHFDPRYGQEDVGNAFRRSTDWIMNQFGEKSTQHINRQPAYLATHERWFNHYRRMGWTEDEARHAATERAAELVNWVFFDNKDIPRFLKDMNKISPFFSAMYEVAQTWAYKIPSENMLPIGYAHLIRRVDRTIQGLTKSGLLDVGPDGQMALRVGRDNEGKMAGIAGLSSGLFHLMRAPVVAAEHLTALVRGVGELVDFDGEYLKYDPANLNSIYKDGIQLGVGNPLDPTSFGVMAVNQFSVGFTPALQLPASMAAEALFAMGDDVVDNDYGTLEEYIANYDETDDVSVKEMMIRNREAIEAVNSREAWRLYMTGELAPSELIMPDIMHVPTTNLWETLVDNTFFPFGKLDSVGEVITSVSPAAMNYVWRGLMTEYLDDVGQNDMVGFFFGQMSNYQVASEVANQLQMLEATEGVLTKSMELSAELQQLVADTAVQIGQQPDGASYILNPKVEGALQAQDLMDRLAALNATTMARANNQAGGALIGRGIMGQFLPGTPRMWDEQQNQTALYWDAKDFAESALATGSANYSTLLEGKKVRTQQDMFFLTEAVQKFMTDPTGDAAKMWVATEVPGLAPFLSGKAYYGEHGLDPHTEGFDKWMEQIESGERKPFPPEVWISRYQRATIATDRQTEIVRKYGPNVNDAAQAILGDYKTYRELMDPYDMQYEAVDFIDEYLFEGKYNEWRKNNFDELTLYELVKEDVQKSRDEVDSIIDILDYTDLSPQEARSIRGKLNAAVRSYTEAVDDLDHIAAADGTWQNPLETVINRYFTDVSTPYYEGRGELYDDLDGVEDKTARSRVFDEIRRYENKWFLGEFAIEGHDGVSIQVPAPVVRSWNGYSQEERQERMLKMVGKNPSWLSLFETNVLSNENELFDVYLPNTPEKLKIYEKVADRKYEITEFAAANPEVMSQYERDKAIREMDERLDKWLIENGRAPEIHYREAVPIQRLDLGGVLPESLKPVVPWVNQTIEELKAQDKSPTTNEGRVAFLALQQYLETVYFYEHPQALIDLDELGLVMFDEPLRAAVYARLLQGDFFGELD
jgi:hypothetical protein